MRCAHEDNRGGRGSTALGDGQSSQFSIPLVSIPVFDSSVSIPLDSVHFK
jgi:hypothetical protein